MKRQQETLLSEFSWIKNATVHWNLDTAELIKKTIEAGQGILSASGALVCDTGKFKGRAPKDKYIVCDGLTRTTVWWEDVNAKMDPGTFEALYEKILVFLSHREIFVQEGYACALKKHRLNLRVLSHFPWQSLFAHNLFLRLSKEEFEAFQPDWTIICAPEFEADPLLDSTRSKNFTIINFSKKLILIGGSAYTGEIKKSVFTILNFLLPRKNVLSMHCSANVGKQGDTALFFGLSGTGKTTLSADPQRMLIGDDEHGWDINCVFNFEGGCYAKCVNLSKEKEPQIFNAIRYGTLLENTCFIPGTTDVDFNNITKTENTRAAYPIHFIENIIESSVGAPPKNIFFLTADAFGVLPPISKLSIGQAMYHFISGYTAKVAGTETGVVEPKPTFSACFAKPFLPLHPVEYAMLLGQKLREGNINVWLINTGWTGGPYGVGKRIELKYTRAMITAALNNQLQKVFFRTDPIFHLETPMTCPNVPDDILHPLSTWKDKAAYSATMEKLALAFMDNFSQYEKFAIPEILAGGPKIKAGAGLMRGSK